MNKKLLDDLSALQRFSGRSLKSRAQAVRPHNHRLRRRYPSEASVCRYLAGNRNIFTPCGLAVWASIISDAGEKLGVGVNTSAGAHKLIAETARLARILRQRLRRASGRLERAQTKVRAASAILGGRTEQSSEPHSEEK